MAIFVQFFLLYVTIVNVEGFNFRAGHKKTAKGVSNVRVFSTLEVSESTTVDKPMPTSTESKTNFDWNKQWYPLAVLDCLDENKPHKYELLGNDIVVWNDGVVWRAMEDSCPHRAVPLSEGRVEKNGELLCAYHGWTFNGSGTCTNIPQADANNKESSLTNLKSCVLSYPTREEQGLLWVWAEKGLPGSDPFIESAIKSPRLIEELKECGDRVCPILYGFTELPYGADMFFENVMDPAHVPVSHHGIMGSRYMIVI
jgi:phenylpropionate dioxygenase-like ring-hydroxylating dioxygenase large terminal subunit